MSRGTLDFTSLSSHTFTGLSPSTVALPSGILLRLLLHVVILTPDQSTKFKVQSSNIFFRFYLYFVICTLYFDPVWALSISLAATLEIDFSFFSSGYLDVSVPRVPSTTLCIHVVVTEVFSAGFPHSDIYESTLVCSSS